MTDNERKEQFVRMLNIHTDEKWDVENFPFDCDDAIKKRCEWLQDAIFEKLDEIQEIRKACDDVWEIDE